MDSEFREVRGMSDLIGEALEKAKFVENIAILVAGRYCFQEIRTPLVEYSSLFERGLGDESDIIHKEMYSFQSRGGESLTLRPEFTSSIARVIASKKVNLPAKIFSYGAAFRYERPQKGRRRQFHQINFECIGADSEIADAEMIFMASDIISLLGIDKNKVSLHVNSLGDKESIVNYKRALVDFLTKYSKSLSEDSQRRLNSNPLRILDSKSEIDIQILSEAPEIRNYRTEKAQMRFEKLMGALEVLPVKFIENQKLVRGLDYYTSTVFEFITSELGAQGTIMAGGRYDELIGNMGAPVTPAVGFAGGIERLSELASLPDVKSRCIHIIPIGAEAEKSVISLANLLRSANFCVDFDYSGTVKGRMKKAGEKALISVIFGLEEMSSKSLRLKNMISGDETVVKASDIVSELEKMVS